LIKRNRYNLWAIYDSNKAANRQQNHNLVYLLATLLRDMEILLFGITRDITGKQKLVVPTAEQPNTVGDLKRWLGEQFPAMKQLSSLAIAVDSEYAEDNLAINNSSEIALIPPVSGG
jgi:molybdopterin synthase sulfur carrier subunit